MVMTEAEWLRCTDVRAMLHCLPWGKHQRKARLFACACCKQISDLLRDNWCRRAIEIVERFVDDRASESERELAERNLLRAIDEIRDQHPYPDYLTQPEHVARSAVRWMLTWGNRIETIETVASAIATAAGLITVLKSRDRSDTRLVLRSAEAQERERQCRLLRDIIGNPFRPVGVDAGWLAWRDSTVPKIAQTIYEERAFGRMPILADALEDAGCTNDDMLTHCRQSNEHVRGCWVVDMLTGRS
jgi:hypothetical protein